MTTLKWSMCKIYKIYASLAYLLNFAGFEGKKICTTLCKWFPSEKNRILIRSRIVMISPPSTANNTGNGTKLNLFARETDRIERTKKSYKKICTKLCKQHYWYPRSCPFPLQTLRSHPFSLKTIPSNMPVSLLNHLFPLPVSLPNPLFPLE